MQDMTETTPLNPGTGPSKQQQILTALLTAVLVSNGFANGLTGPLSLVSYLDGFPDLSHRPAVANPAVMLALVFALIGSWDAKLAADKNKQFEKPRLGFNTFINATSLALLMNQWADEIYSAYFCQHITEDQCQGPNWLYFCIAAGLMVFGIFEVIKTLLVHKYPKETFGEQKKALYRFATFLDVLQTASSLQTWPAMFLSWTQKTAALQSGIFLACVVAGIVPPILKECTSLNKEHIDNSVNTAVAWAFLAWMYQYIIDRKNDVLVSSTFFLGLFGAALAGVTLASFIHKMCSTNHEETSGLLADSVESGNRSGEYASLPDLTTLRDTHRPEETAAEKKGCASVSALLSSVGQFAGRSVDTVKECLGRDNNTKLQVQGP